MTRPIYILTTLLLVSCGTNEALKTPDKNLANCVDKVTNAPDNWEFETVQNKSLLFKNGRSFETGLFELEYIGQIPVDKKAPYLIYSGRDCNGCDANISIYVHSPSDGSLAVERGQNRYEYPGTLKYYEDNRVLQTSKAFYGQVLPNVVGILWHISGNSLTKKGPGTIYLVRFENGSRKDTSFVSEFALGQTIILARKGLCKEIPGREFTSEP